MGCASSTPVQEAEEKKASPAPVKTPATAVAADAPPPSVEAKLEATLLTDDAPTVPATCSIIIVYYSMYGHVSQLATALAEGINGVPGCSAKLLQVRNNQSVFHLPADVCSASARHPCGHWVRVKM